MNSKLCTRHAFVIFLVAAKMDFDVGVFGIWSSGGGIVAGGSGGDIVISGSDGIICVSDSGGSIYFASLNQKAVRYNSVILLPPAWVMVVSTLSWKLWGKGFIS